MNPEGRQQLLHDVLAGTAFDRDGLMIERTLLGVRRWRRLRRAAQTGTVCSLLAMSLMAFWDRPGIKTTATQPEFSNPPVARISSQPLPASMQVRSASSALKVATTLEGHFEIVSTRPGPACFQRIGDEELVLLAGAPAVVLHVGEKGAQLVVLSGGVN